MLSKTLLLVATVASAVTEAAPTTSNKPPLRFTADGTFHISVFNDMHFGENSAGQGPLWDGKTSQLMGNIMDAERPQLVVLNGDLISGDQYQRPDILDHVDRIVKPIAARRLPWASTYGNHDSNYNLSRDKMFQREKTYNGSYTERMVDGENAGVTNYYLPVYAADGYTSSGNSTDCLPELLLWFFDSRGGTYYRTHHGQPDWVDVSVVEWFNATSGQLAAAYGRVVPSIAFVHIPVHATKVLQTQGPGGHVDLRRHPGINDDKINGQSSSHGGGGNVTAHSGGRGGYGGNDVPFMQALAAADGLIGLFYGHDHGNTWCYRWTGRVDGLGVEVRRAPGLHMCYGQHAGYGGYGNWIRGGRQVVATREGVRAGTLRTHTRLETGEVVGAVTLNGTFNEDVYAAVPDTRTTMQLAGSKEQPTRAASTGARTGSPAAAAMVLVAALTLSALLC
ncbi:Metallophosphoesterase [Cordyceps fumosorosea ARSEF 2679]|uniref:Metallophosphoesterase n=1 Tax=Cordyceps fumosorosea (strain ARSEF 2679) TaxID=1081104 RepID=A0A167U9S5_CORFA|nr:Metallophosphoesterase [Cordyceps fumosorosea ARSEF 2679]OAA61362.1 Metallophosphoesterase [Cordyceps fumosorosea ARSEF 2679]